MAAGRTTRGTSATSTASRLRPEALWATATALVALLAAVPSLGLLAWDPRQPFVLGTDGTQISMQLKTIHEFGWYWTNPDLGFPLGLNGSWFPELNVLHVAVVKLLDLVVGNGFTAGGVYLVASFPLTGLTMYLLARSQGLSPVAGFVGGVLLANAPGHAGRYGHLYLAQYWVVPVALWLVLEVARGGSLWSGRVLGSVPRRAVTVAAVVVVGLSGAYYVGFTLILLLVAAAARRSVGTPRDLLRGLAVSAGLVAAIAVPLALARLGTAGDLVTGRVPATRLPSESERYAGKLMDLLLPWPAHRVGALETLSEAYNGTTAATIEVSALGIVGVIGLAVLSAAGFAALLAGRGADRRLLLWAGLALASFLLYTVGGMGSFIALFATPQLRTWSRMSLYLLVLTLLAVGWLLTRLEARRGGVAALVVGSLVAVIGVLDQTNPAAAPDHAEARATMARLQTYVTELESATASGCAVFQLPVVDYPESGPYLDMDDYDQLQPYLPESGLRFSAGAMRGTAASTWMRAIDTSDLEALGDDLRAAGFCAVEVDTRGFTDEQDPRGRLEGAFGDPVASTSDGELVAFRLPDAQADATEQQRRTDHLLRPVLVDLAAYAPEEVKGVTGQYVGPAARLSVANLAEQPRPVAMRLSVRGIGSEVREVAVRDGDTVLAEATATEDAPATLDLELTAPTGLTQLVLTVGGPAVRPAADASVSTAFVSVTSATSSADARIAVDQQQVATGWVVP